MMHQKSKGIATIIVARAKDPQEAVEKTTEDSSPEEYNDMADCLKLAFSAMQSGDFEAASKHMKDWHTLAHADEDMSMNPNTDHGYMEKES